MLNKNKLSKEVIEKYNINQKDYIDILENFKCGLADYIFSYKRHHLC